MKYKNAFVWVASCISAVCMFLIVLFFAVEMTAFNVDFYMSEYKKYKVADDVNMEYSEIEKVTSHMIEYMRGNNDSLNIKVQVGDEYRFFFNEKELSHMDDVKILFLGGITIRNVALIIFFICTAVLLFFKAKKSVIVKSYKFVFAFIFLIVIAVGCLILSDFSKYFTGFHEVFFDNDLWLLDPATDLLINLLPEGFFMDCVIRVCVIFAGCFLLLPAAYYAIAFLNKKRG